jgi:hypothetical protein
MASFVELRYGEVVRTKHFLDTLGEIGKGLHSGISPGFEGSKATLPSAKGLKPRCPLL